MQSELSTTTIIALREISGNVPAELSTIQVFLFEHLVALTYIWWGIFFITMLTAIFQIFKQRS